MGEEGRRNGGGQEVVKRGLEGESLRGREGFKVKMFYATEFKCAS